MDKKRSLFFSILSLGALFALLVFTAPNEADRKRYLGEVEELVVDSLDETVDEGGPQADLKPVDTTHIVGVGSVAPEYEFYDVVRVVDGDTVKIMRGGKEETLRLIGMNTPETVDPRTTVECFGKEASNKAKELLTGKRVRLEFDAGEGTVDKYRRTLAYLYRDDGLFFNQWMIEHGYAYEYTYDNAYKYQSEFKTAEAYARDHTLGLWSPDTCSGEL